MPREAEFNFCKINTLATDDEESYYVSLYSGQLKIPKRFVIKYNLEGQFVEFLADRERRVLCFRRVVVIEGKFNKNTMKRISVNKSGIAAVSIGRILPTIGFSTTESMLKLPLKPYKAPTYGDVWYFALKKQKHEDENRKNAE